MKILTLSLQYFKRFYDKKLDFRDSETGLAKDIIVLVGKNGSGKSTILQAIAAMLGTATGRLKSPIQLDWPGYDLALVNHAWSRPPGVQAEFSFTPDEIKATQEYFERSFMAGDQSRIKPGSDLSVKLRLDFDRLQVLADTSTKYYQFRGREYASIILRNAPEGHGLFKRVGTVFWYTEHRTTNSLTPLEENGKPIKFDLDLIRRRLSDFMGFHERISRGERQLRSGERDLFADLERAYQAVFPRRRFDGPVPRAEIDEVLAEPWFYFYDGSHTYELSEMSGGERSVFPMLFDFANWNIHNSVILIDEFELHLHPPLQQSFLQALRNLGENNQFIITTHSDAVANLIPTDSLYRLED